MMSHNEAVRQAALVRWQENRLLAFVRQRLPYSLLHLVLISVGVICIVPFIWMFSTSFKLQQNVFMYPPQWIPQPITFEGYETLFTAMPFGRQFLNTLFVCAVIISGQLLFSSMGAYAFARLRFPGRDTLFLLFLATMMVPSAVTLIPSFIVIRQFGWINTYMAIIGPAVLGSAFATFFLRQFMLTIPTELEDAARIDGAGHFMIFIRIVLPLIRPALSVLAVFGFVYFWNDFLWPLIVINSDDLKTVTVGIATLSRGYFGTRWNVLMAGATLTILPLLVAYFMAQKQFIDGITITGMKS